MLKDVKDESDHSEDVNYFNGNENEEADILKDISEVKVNLKEVTNVLDKHEEVGFITD